MQNLDFNYLEAQIHSVLDRLSNNEPVEIKQQWVYDATEHIKDALYKQFSVRDRPFKLMMSNIGKPLCQLQNEKDSIPKARLPYNHIMRMMIGDITEAIVRVVLQSAGIEIGSAVRHNIVVNGTTISGKDDVTIDKKIWDIKSSSPYQFEYKWRNGWDYIFQNDDFGYCAQLYSYANRDPKLMGGWIVVNKSTGEIIVVEAQPNPVQLEVLRDTLEDAQDMVNNDRPFKRGFIATDEYFSKKPTGNKLVPEICTMCPFMQSTRCWSHAIQHKQALSKAKDPKMIWYAEITNFGSEK